ncbi:hypothetical protein Nepgr_023604 [Nepenthes gracilis]|uniref:Homeobox-leucine zipper protein n=1 Tax=Nepenthes gracilis TaxID=150966 RepID=A0AAD3XXV4_NEPGR|nr:hypothetical protein Nepgr_023604 [Nepenthes gracilis]
MNRKIDETSIYGRRKARHVMRPHWSLRIKTIRGTSKQRSQAQTGTPKFKAIFSGKPLLNPQRIRSCGFNLNRMLDEGEYSPSAAASDASVSVSSSKKKLKNKRRFTDEQIRSLESIFQNETKLEPRRKLQLSRELGLQPRQVAIWFQNKRARWKSKQLERDYDVLKANYNALASRFENLKKEKQSLAIQLQKLYNLAPSAAAGSSIDPPLENDDDDRREGESNRRLLPERSEYGSAFLSDDGCVH